MICVGLDSVKIKLESNCKKAVLRPEPKEFEKEKMYLCYVKVLILWAHSREASCLNEYAHTSLHRSDVEKRSFIPVQTMSTCIVTDFTKISDSEFGVRFLFGARECWMLSKRLTRTQQENSLNNNRNNNNIKDYLTAVF